MTGNRGFQTLACLVEQIRHLPADTRLLDSWCARRLPALTQLFRKWTAKPHTDAFANDYAASLAREIMRLLASQDFEGAAEAVIEAVEDLARQTEPFAKDARSVPAIDEEPFLPGLSPARANTDLALAA